MKINSAFVIAPQNMFGEFNLSCRDIQSKISAALCVEEMQR
jgi:hypothetical protein